MKTIAYFACLLLLMLNLFMFYKLTKSIELISNLELKIKQDSIDQFNNFDQLINNINQVQLNNNKKINPESILIDVENKKCTLESLVTSNPKLFIFFNTYGCHTCIKSEMEILKNFVNLIGHSNVVIITTHASARNLLVFKKEFGIQIPLYCTSTDPPIDAEVTVFEFILDKQFIVKNLFIPISTFPQLSDNFYSNLMRTYFQSSELR